MVRVASYNVSLTRRGPGVLLRDIRAGKDRQIGAVLQIITRVRPDILVLSGFDYDADQAALGAFRRALKKRGVAYPYVFSRAPNSGLRSGVDLDGDGKTDGPGDAQGYGRFFGAGGMAVLSRLPIIASEVQDYTAGLWRDFPGALKPRDALGRIFPSRQAWKIQRLSSTNHWVVPVRLGPGRLLHLLISHPTPPVFDGAEDRNGRRNHDEVAFWSRLIGQGGVLPPFVVAGDLNIDPLDGAGRKDAIQGLLSSRVLQDPAPSSTGAILAVRRQGGANLTHRTPAGLDTVDWDERKGPGNMRVDYVLPSVDLKVVAAGVFWPPPGRKAARLVRAAAKGGTRHHLVWVDLQ